MSFLKAATAGLLTVALIAGSLGGTAQASEPSEQPEPTPLNEGPRPIAQAEDGWYTYTIGFYDTPPVDVGDPYHGGVVTSRNDVLNFISVRTRDAMGMEARAMSGDGVRYAEPAPMMTTLETLDAWAPGGPGVKAPVSDTFAHRQWSLWGTPGIDAYGAWTSERGSKDVVVAVLDTGVDLAHEDLRNVLPGRNFVDPGEPPQDGNGHGTHVAGTVGAVTHNDQGVAGIAQVSILPGKVLNDRGGGSFNELAEAIVWAVEEGADVIAMSLGCPAELCRHTATEEALAYAASEGVLNVCAAGNSGPTPDSVVFPADSEHCMAVSNLQQDGTLHESSSRGPEVEIAAPGTDIASTCPDDTYCLKSGTSMAAPHVAGVAALVVSSANMTGGALRAHLTDTAVDLGLAAGDQGAGAVNAAAAVDAEPSDPDERPADPPREDPPREDGEGGEVHVGDITYDTREGAGGSADLYVKVHVRDARGDPVAGVDVCVDLNRIIGNSGATACRETDQDGIAQFVIRDVERDVYHTCVTDLRKDGYTWNREADDAMDGSCHAAIVSPAS